MIWIVLDNFLKPGSTGISYLQQEHVALLRLPTGRKTILPFDFIPHRLPEFVLPVVIRVSRPGYQNIKTAFWKILRQYQPRSGRKVFSINKEPVQWHVVTYDAALFTQFPTPTPLSKMRWTDDCEVAWNFEQNLRIRHKPCLI